MSSTDACSAYLTMPALAALARSLSRRARRPPALLVRALFNASIVDDLEGERLSRRAFLAGEGAPTISNSTSESSSDDSSFMSFANVALAASSSLRASSSKRRLIDAAKASLFASASWSAAASSAAMASSMAAARLAASSCASVSATSSGSFSCFGSSVSQSWAYSAAWASGSNAGASAASTDLRFFVDLRFLHLTSGASSLYRRLSSSDRAFHNTPNRFVASALRLPPDTSAKASS